MNGLQELASMPGQGAPGGVPGEGPGPEGPGGLQQLASMPDQGPQPGPPIGGQGGPEQAVQAISEGAKMFRMAMASDPGLHILQPDLEKLILKIAKYYGYDQEVKLSMQRAKEQQRVGGPPPMPGGGPGPGGPSPGGPPPM